MSITDKPIGLRNYPRHPQCLCSCSNRTDLLVPSELCHVGHFCSLRVSGYMAAHDIHHCSRRWQRGSGPVDQSHFDHGSCDNLARF